MQQNNAFLYPNNAAHQNIQMTNQPRKSLTIPNDSGYASMLEKSGIQNNSSLFENEGQSLKRDYSMLNYDPYADPALNNHFMAKRTLQESEVNLASSNLLAYSEDQWIQENIRQQLELLEAKYENSHPRYTVFERRQSICNLLNLVRKTPLNFELQHLKQIICIIKTEFDSSITGNLVQIFYVLSFSADGCEKLLSTAITSISRDLIVKNCDEGIFYLVGALHNILTHVPTSKENFIRINLHKDLIPMLNHTNVKVISITMDIIAKLASSDIRIKHELFEDNVHQKLQQFLWRKNDADLIIKCCQLINILCTSKKFRENFLKCSLVDSLSALIRSTSFGVIKSALACINLLVVDMCAGLDKNPSYIMQINKLLFLLFRRCLETKFTALNSISLEIILRLAQNNEQTKADILRLKGIPSLMKVLTRFNDNSIIADVFLCLKVIFKIKTQSTVVKKSMFNEFQNYNGCAIVDSLLCNPNIDQSVFYRIMNFLVDLLYIDIEFDLALPISQLTMYKIFEIYQTNSFKYMKPLPGICQEAIDVCCLSAHIATLQCVLLITVKNIKHFSPTFQFEQIIMNLIEDTSHESVFVKGLAFWILEELSKHITKWTTKSIEAYTNKFSLITLPPDYAKEVSGTLKNLKKSPESIDDLSSFSKTAFSSNSSAAS